MTGIVFIGSALCALHRDGSRTRGLSLSGEVTIQRREWLPVNAPALMLSGHHLRLLLTLISIVADVTLGRGAHFLGTSFEARSLLNARMLRCNMETLRRREEL